MNTAKLRTSELATSTNVTIKTTDNVDDENQPQPNEDVDHVWENFKLSKSSNRTNDINLLRDPRTSIFGDICINVGNHRYILDRVILASKSRHLEHLFFQYDDNEIENIINSLMEGDSRRFSTIVELIYGKELASAVNEHNFVQLFIDMDQIDLEIDQEVFKNFIDEKIRPKGQLNNSMFRLFNYMNNFSAMELEDEHKYDYLLPTVGQYFSDRLAKVHRRREFLSMSLKAFCLVLMNEKTSSDSLDFVIHVGAEWICHQSYRYRMKMSRDVVNAIKYRFELYPYSNWDALSVIRSLKMNGIFDRPDVQQMEKVLIQLIEHVHYHADVKFMLSSDLKAEICNLDPRSRITNQINHVTKWMSYFEESQFCDVIVDVQGFKTGLKLHRAKLASASDYFYNLFTKSNRLSASGDSNYVFESNLKKYLIREIDPVTFQNLVLYIYEQEIEITSLTELKSLLCGSKFLKIDDLYEKCSSKMLEIIEDLPSDDIFHLFRYVCENDKHSELYNGVVKRIVDLWPDLDEVPELDEITLAALREIVALPQLKFDSYEEIDR